MHVAVLVRISADLRCKDRVHQLVWLRSVVALERLARTVAAAAPTAADALFPSLVCVESVHARGHAAQQRADQTSPAASSEDPQCHPHRRSLDPCCCQPSPICLAKQADAAAVHASPLVNPRWRTA